MTSTAHESTASLGLRQGSWQAFDVLWERDQMVAMRDGIHLAADVYRPAEHGLPAAGSFPVLLERTPYNKLRADLVSTAKFFARRGYVVVLQDVRGRFASEGEWYAFALEGPD